MADWYERIEQQGLGFQMVGKMKLGEALLFLLERHGEDFVEGWEWISGEDLGSKCSERVIES